jgi:6-phosphogluconolactonase
MATFPVETGGVAPCHLAMDRRGSKLIVANYVGGNAASYSINPDGRLSEMKSSMQHSGKGATPRQEAPHAHSTDISPNGRVAFVCDLGLDRVKIYGLDQQAVLTPWQEPEISLAPGAGPRHLAFHPKQRLLYVLNELNSTITQFKFENGFRKFAINKSVSTLPKDFSAANTTAEILIHPNGKFVYASNRGHDSIAMFDSSLNLLGHEPTQGKNPRNFAIDPRGQWLLAANQNSNNVAVFAIDQSSGLLKAKGEQASVPWPVCVTFAGRA